MADELSEFISGNQDSLKFLSDQLPFNANGISEIIMSLLTGQWNAPATTTSYQTMSERQQVKQMQQLQMFGVETDQGLSNVIGQLGTAIGGKQAGKQMQGLYESMPVILRQMVQQSINTSPFGGLLGGDSSAIVQAAAGLGNMGAGFEGLTGFSGQGLGEEFSPLRSQVSQEVLQSVKEYFQKDNGLANIQNLRGMSFDHAGKFMQQMASEGGLSVDSLVSGVGPGGNLEMNQGELDKLNANIKSGMESFRNLSNVFGSRDYAELISQAKRIGGLDMGDASSIQAAEERIVKIRGLSAAVGADERHVMGNIARGSDVLSSMTGMSPQEAAVLSYVATTNALGASANAKAMAGMAEPGSYLHTPSFETLTRENQRMVASVIQEGDSNPTSLSRMLAMGHSIQSSNGKEIEGALGYSLGDRLKEISEDTSLNAQEKSNLVAVELDKVRAATGMDPSQLSTVPMAQLLERMSDEQKEDYLNNVAGGILSVNWDTGGTVDRQLKLQGLDKGTLVGLGTNQSDADTFLQTFKDAQMDGNLASTLGRTQRLFGEGGEYKVMDKDGRLVNKDATEMSVEERRAAELRLLKEEGAFDGDEQKQAEYVDSMLRVKAENEGRNLTAKMAQALQFHDQMAIRPGSDIKVDDRFTGEMSGTPVMNFIDGLLTDQPLPVSREGELGSTKDILDPKGFLLNTSQKKLMEKYYSKSGDEREAFAKENEKDLKTTLGDIKSRILPNLEVDIEGKTLGERFGLSQDDIQAIKEGDLSALERDGVQMAIRDYMSEGENNKFKETMKEAGLYTTTRKLSEKEYDDIYAEQGLTREQIDNYIKGKAAKEYRGLSDEREELVSGFFESKAEEEGISREELEARIMNYDSEELRRFWESGGKIDTMEGHEGGNYLSRLMDNSEEMERISAEVAERFGKDVKPEDVIQYNDGLTDEQREAAETLVKQREIELSGGQQTMVYGEGSQERADRLKELWHGRKTEELLRMDKLSEEFGFDDKNLWDHENEKDRIEAAKASRKELLGSEDVQRILQGQGQKGDMTMDDLVAKMEAAGFSKDEVIDSMTAEFKKDDKRVDPEENAKLDAIKQAFEDLKPAGGEGLLEQIGKLLASIDRLVQNLFNDKGSGAIKN
jgi:hypothetical protein